MQRPRHFAELAIYSNHLREGRKNFNRSFRNFLCHFLATIKILNSNNSATFYLLCCRRVISILQSASPFFHDHTQATFERISAPFDHNGLIHFSRNGMWSIWKGIIIISTICISNSSSSKELSVFYIEIKNNFCPSHPNHLTHTQTYIVLLCICNYILYFCIK